MTEMFCARPVAHRLPLTPPLPPPPDLSRPLLTPVVHVNLSLVIIVLFDVCVLELTCDHIGFDMHG